MYSQLKVNKENTRTHTNTRLRRRSEKDTHVDYEIDVAIIAGQAEFLNDRFK